MIRNDGDWGAATAPRWIGPTELRSLVSMADAIREVEHAMRALSRRHAHAPQRWTMPLAGTARMGLMPGALPGAGRFGVKVLSLFDAAARGNLPSHQGVMLLFDMADGRPLCAVDAAALTNLRTAAATATATKALARPESETLAIIGCGDQAELHLAAMRTILPIRRVALWNRTRDKAERFAARLLADLETTICASPAAAVRDADVICMLTSASEPILAGPDVRPGQHINLVGSSTVGSREVDDELVARSRYFVDCREHALGQAAELRSAIEHGLVGDDHIVGEIGQVLLGKVYGRTHGTDLTVYKSLGHVVQDLAVADAAYAAAASLSGGPFILGSPTAPAL